jgi:hypothetical protein
MRWASRRSFGNGLFLTVATGAFLHFLSLRTLVLMETPLYPFAYAIHSAFVVQLAYRRDAGKSDRSDVEVVWMLNVESRE